MTGAFNLRQGEETMGDQLRKLMRDPDVISACVSGLLAALVMSYVVSVSPPSAIHILLAAIGLAGILGGFLFIARAKIEPEWKAAVAIGGGLISVVCFVLLSTLY